MYTKIHKITSTEVVEHVFCQIDFQRVLMKTLFGLCMCVSLCQCPIPGYGRLYALMKLEI